MLKDIAHTKFCTCKGMLSAIEYWKLNEIESNYWNKSDLDNLLLSFIMIINPFIRSERCVPESIFVENYHNGNT